MSYKSRIAVKLIASLLIFIFSLSEISHAATLDVSAASVLSSPQEILLQNLTHLPAVPSDLKDWVNFFALLLNCFVLQVYNPIILFDLQACNDFF